MQLLEDGRSGRLNAVFQHSLDDPTAIGMFRELTNLPSKSVDDKLDVFGGYPFDGFLHDVVPVLILHASHNLFVFL